MASRGGRDGNVAPVWMTLVMIGMCTLPAGLLCFVWRWLLVRRRVAFAARSRWADGVVVARPVTVSPDSVTTRIVVQWVDDTGQTRRTRSVSSSGSFPDVGGIARVLYLPDNPSTARIELDMRNGEWIAGLFAFLFSGIAIVLVASLLVMKFAFPDAWEEMSSDELVNTTAPPGDVDAYRPFAHLAAIGAYAGDNAELVSIEATNVRADGTVFLGVRQDERISQVVLVFIADATERDKRTLFKETDKVEVRVTIREPHITTVSTADGIGEKLNRGMQRDPMPALRAMLRSRELAPAPKCTAAQLVELARAKGAPALLARLEYDAEGYELHTRQNGDPLHLKFDHDCRLR